MHEHDPQYLKSMFRLLMVMEDRALPVPLSIGWRVPYRPDQPPHLHVQVEGCHYRTWYAAMADVVVRSDGTGNDIHIHTWGVLADNPQVSIHMVAVTADEAVFQ